MQEMFNNTGNLILHNRTHRSIQQNSGNKKKKKIEWIELNENEHMFAKKTVYFSE